MLMRNREVGRVGTTPNRVFLQCEQLEARETPTASVLDPAVGAGGKVFETHPGQSAVIAVQPAASVVEANSGATAPAVGSTASGGTAIDVASLTALFAQAQVTPFGQVMTTPNGNGLVTPARSSPSTTRLTASSTAPTVGQTVTLTATVTASGLSTRPGGTVTFKDGATTIGTASLVNGVASFTWRSPAPGRHSLTAVYGGGGALQGSTSASVTVTVSKWRTQLATPFLSITSPAAGVPFNVYASLNILSAGTTAGPGGTITFEDGSTILGRVALNPKGRTELTIPGLSAGTHSITEVYSGDAKYAGATSAALSLTVKPNKVTPRLSTPYAGNAHPTVGTPVTLSVSFAAPTGTTATPTGTVTFIDGRTVLGSVLLNARGSTQFTVSGLSAGTHSITAVYGGDGHFNFVTSSALSLSVVSKVTPRLSTPYAGNAHPTAGTAVTISVSFIAPGGTTATPTGTVTFKDGNTVLGTVPLNPRGATQLTVSRFSAGTHSITAVYTGDGHFNAVLSATLSLTVIPSKVTPRLSAPSFSNAHPPAGTPVTISVALTVPTGTRATPGGSVTFKDGNTFLGTVTLNARGQASITLSNLAAGTHSIVAVYTGDGHFNAVTSSASLTVNKPSPVKTSVRLSAVGLSDSHPTTGSPLTLVVSFSLGSTSAYTPGGMVTFRDGNTILGTVPLNAHGQTILTLYNLAAGPHSFSAIYSGDAHFYGATSAATAVTVSPPGKPAVQVSIATVGKINSDQSILFQVVVTSYAGTPGGWVDITEGSKVWGRIQLDGHGKAALAIGTGMSRGTHTVTATYEGSARFASGSSSTTFTLVPAQF
jgi:hypothetical protein